MNSLFRCCVCRAYTLLPPMFIIRSWRVHLSCCIDCALNENVPFESHVMPAHRKLLIALRLLFSGRWVWSPESLLQ